MKVGFDQEWWKMDRLQNNDFIMHELTRRVEDGYAIYLHFHEHGEPCVDECRDAAFDHAEHQDLTEFEAEFEQQLVEPSVGIPGHGSNCVCHMCTSLGKERREWE